MTIIVLYLTGTSLELEDVQTWKVESADIHNFMH